MFHGHIPGASGPRRGDHRRKRGPSEGARGDRSGEPPGNARRRRDLTARKIVVLPDIMVNAGGVTVSYFEWTQNIQQFRWSLERVNEELESRVVSVFSQLMARANKDGVRPRQTAFDIAVERVGKAIVLRGFV